jgi:Family of unknown function (DUF6644)
MATLLSFCQWLGDTSLSIGIRESTWVYPVIESVHVLSLCVFVGLLVLWDLRLVGITLKRVAVSEVWSWLIPWITLGAALMVISGVLLFASDPVKFYGNIFFRLKAAGLFLALINAIAFHLGVERHLPDWDTAAVTPRAARLAGGVSIGLWAFIVLTGRFVAYNWFPPLT